MDKAAGAREEAESAETGGWHSLPCPVADVMGVRVDEGKEREGGY